MTGFSARRPVLLGLTTLLLTGALLLGWGLWARIDGAVIVSGRIEVEHSNQIIQHPTGGVVSELAVREGDRVAAGDLLLRLEDLGITAELESLRARRDEASARKARLEAERDTAPSLLVPPELATRRASDPALAAVIAAQESLFEAGRDSAARQAQQLSLQSAQIEAQVAALHAQLAALADLDILLGRDLEQQTSLAQKGLTPAQALNALYREKAQIEANRARLVGAEAEARERGAEIELMLSEAEARRRDAALSELRELEPALLDLGLRLKALEAKLRALDIRAPVAGRVYGLTIFAPQSVVRPAEPILYLIPEGRDLVITALVPAILIDKVHEGQSVSLRLPAVLEGRLPPLRAEVRSLSGDVFDDRARGPVYRAELALVGDAAQLPAGQRLLPGMPVEAFLLTGERAPLAYLVSPLARYFSRAFRSG